MRRSLLLRTMSLVVLMSLIAPALNAQPAPAPPPGGAPIQGKIDGVTVYRGQALVTRLVDVPGPAGLREVVVTDLPARIVPNSLYAESADGAEVRSVLYRERPTGQDVREEVRKLDEQIRATQDLITANLRQTQLLGEQKEYLAKLEQFVAPTAQAELSKGVLNAETLKGLTTFQFEQRKSIAEGELTLAKDARDLNEKLNTLQRQRTEITGGSARTVREAVVFANFPGGGGGGGGGKLRVRYLVNAATWFPSYNVRAERGAKQVTVEFNASIQQMSGEDWTDVQMTLSTATPSLVAVAPVLDPLSIALAPLATAQKPDSSAMGYRGAKAQLEQKREQIDMLRNNASGPQQQGQAANAAPGLGDQLTLDRRLNDVAAEMQVLEILAKDARDRDMRPGSGPASPKDDEGVSVTYQLAARTSLPSRQDTQQIQIASAPMKADFFKLAAPVLTNYVYDQATVTNDGKMVLLAGPVASYLAGQFVGSGQIPTVAVGETFTAGFGIDSSLRASRELVDKSETVQGGNKVVTFNYKLSVENFGAAPTAVRLTDRLPTTKDDGVKITLGPTSKEISTDAAYQQTERKKGLLRWDVEVPAQAIGTKAVSVDYQYKLEYDKQMTIAGMPSGK